MHGSLHSVSTYFRTQAPVYQAQATQPLTQQYSYSTYISSGRLTSSTDTNIRHTKYTCFSYNITQEALQEKLLTNIKRLAGTQTCLTQFWRSHIGNGESILDPCCRRRECKVKRNRIQSQRKPILTFSNSTTFPTSGLSCAQQLPAPGWSFPGIPSRRSEDEKGLTFVEIITHYENSGNAHNIHF